MTATRGTHASSESEVDRERDFYDSAEFERGLATVMRRLIRRSIGEFSTFPEFFGMYDARGRDALDFGCGRGYVTLRLAEAGARSVAGIDLSRNEVEHARRRATEQGFGDRIAFSVGDAHQTPFEDESFDLIVGSAILHHLELERALHEVRRLLRPGGEAVFVEPLWHNPILRLGRALSPGTRTDDEHPLTESDWDLCMRTFDRFSHTERELTTTLLMPLNPLLPRRVQARLVGRFAQLDVWVMRRFPRARKYARVTFLRFGRDARPAAEREGSAAG